jgi:cell division initiation protein
MDISAKILREVEFRDRLRGYDTDEVDDFLERVAVGFDELTAELNAALARADRAEHQAPAPAPAVQAASMEDTSDSIKRTLVLAQRTADLAVREAQDEASKILEDARAAAAAAMSDARSSAELARSKAEQDLRDVVDRLSAERGRLETEVASLVALISSERTRLTNTLKAMLVKIDDINVSPEVRSVAAPSDAASSPAEGQAGVSAISSAAVSPLGGLLAEPDDDLEPEDEEELDLHFALPDPPRPLAEDAARSAADNSFRERLADPLDPDEELWDRWARTGENQVVGGDDSSGEAGRNN